MASLYLYSWNRICVWYSFLVIIRALQSTHIVACMDLHFFLAIRTGTFTLSNHRFKTHEYISMFKWHSVSVTFQVFFDFVNLVRWYYPVWTGMWSMVCILCFTKDNVNFLYNYLVSPSPYILCLHHSCQTLLPISMSNIKMFHTRCLKCRPKYLPLYPLL